MNWYEAYAFCIWDGGFLPSEAEWEYAAAGGNEQREFPWGTAAPGTSSQYAIYGCYYASGPAMCSSVATIAPVGTATLGAGLWGQLDLAGEVRQWILDAFASPYSNQGADAACLTGPSRVIRGGAYFETASYLVPVLRGYIVDPGGTSSGGGGMGGPCVCGPCQPPCTPGNTRCSGNSGVQTCGAGGQWGSSLLCEGSGTCVGWTSACDGGACDAGAAACSSDAGQAG